MFIEKKEFTKCLSYENVDIRKVISTIEEGGLRIALIVNNQNELIGTISDGDIRRGLLKGFSLESPISTIIQRKCLKAKSNSPKEKISEMMKENGICQIPIVSDKNKLIGLEITEDLLPSSSKLLVPNHALLMAGGRGSRLKPITNKCPKPLLPINGKPILEIILEQCINFGIRNFYISVHYLAEKIINYFGDGSKWNVNIKYVKEQEPLGTAGALRLLPNDFGESLILINGDVLSKINFQDVLKYHEVNSADVTICAREQILNSPFGVIEVEGIEFTSMTEKPSYKQLVNAGVYVLNSQIIKNIKPNQYLDMPDLINYSKQNGRKIIVYPIHEYWLDVGKPESLEKAMDEWGTMIEN